MSMHQFWEKCIKYNMWFYVLSSISVVFLIVSFFMPPSGMIDRSVIAAVGEIFGFCGLGSVVRALDKGTSARISHGQTTLVVGDDDGVPQRPMPQPEYHTPDEEIDA